MATVTYVSEDYYVNDFLTSRSSNIDSAYQRIIQDMISVMRNFQIIVTTPDGRSINMDYVFNKIKIETQLLGKTQYVFINGTSIHQRMSDTLVEQHSHQDEQQQKLERLYKRLKESVTTRIELDLPTESLVSPCSEHRVPPGFVPTVSSELSRESCIGAWSPCGSVIEDSPCKGISDPC